MASDKRWPKVCSFVWGPSQAPRVPACKSVIQLVQMTSELFTERFCPLCFHMTVRHLERCLLCETAEMSKQVFSTLPRCCLSLQLCSPPPPYLSTLSLSPSSPTFLSPRTSPFPLSLRPPHPRAIFFLSLTCVLARSPIHTCLEGTTQVSFSSYPCKCFLGIGNQVLTAGSLGEITLPFVLEERWSKSDKVPTV